MGGASSKTKNVASIASQSFKSSQAQNTVKQATGNAPKISMEANEIPQEQNVSKPKTSTPPSSNLMEMNEQLLHEMERFEDLADIKYLDTSMDGYENTASSKRGYSSQPASLPTNRSASRDNYSNLVQDIPGRLTGPQLRTFLRLHYEDATTWNAKTLAEHYQLDEDVCNSIINNIGPPNVLKPTSSTEAPYGIWFAKPDKV